MKPSQLTDQQLLAQICEGKQLAFSELVRRHTNKFFRLALANLGNTNDAEEVVQTAFIKLWQNPTAYQPSKAKFTTWFYRVMINQCHDLGRLRERSKLLLDKSFDHTDDQSLSSEETRLQNSSEQKDRQSALRLAIRDLPSNQRDAINLQIYSDLSQRQIAYTLQLSEKAVESLLVRAKRNLRARFAQSDNLDKATICEKAI